MASREKRHSVCALDCPDACAMWVHIENGRGIRLEGRPDHPVTRGFLCGKVAQYLEREYHPQRLLHPMKRVGAKGEGRLERISWDEALDTVAARLRSLAEEFGPEAILPYSYGGTLGYLQGSGMDRRFFHRLGASRLDRTICATAGGVAMMESLGNRFGTEPEQIPHAKLILAWGANIHGTNVHYWPFIVEARRRGAKLYTIDPVRTRTAELADRHYFVNAGSDLALALGMMHVILAEGLEDRDYAEQHTEDLADLRRKAGGYTPQRVAEWTGIPAEEIVALAREYATTKPAYVRVNYGIQRSDRGGRAVQAVAGLAALTGQWRHLGGGFVLSTSGAFALNRAALEREDLMPKASLVVNMSLLGSALTEENDPPVKALVVYNSNPAAIAPRQALVRQGLQREDLFTVVLEHFQTDTADYADIVLPATTFLEHTDIYFSYGHYYIQMARPALAPPGEARPNVEIFRALAQRMGFADACFRDSADDMIRQLLDTPHPFLQGITLERLEREGFVRLNVAPEGEPFRPFATGGFGTATGKFRFNAEHLDYVPPVESRHGDAARDGRYPLELISSKNDDSMNSTFGYRAGVDAQTAQLWLHGEDAAARGIAEGDRVRVFNDRGSVFLKAQVNGKVHRGAVRAPSTRWAKSSDGGANVNTLVSDRLTDLGGGPVFYSTLVQVEKCGD